jgi:hypothetical protein
VEADLPLAAELPGRCQRGTIGVGHHQVPGQVRRTEQLQRLVVAVAGFGDHAGVALGDRGGVALADDPPKNGDCWMACCRSGLRSVV